MKFYIIMCWPGGSYLKDIYNNLTTLILNGKLENNNEILKEYIVNNY